MSESTKVDIRLGIATTAGPTEEELALEAALLLEQELGPPVETTGAPLTAEEMAQVDRYLQKIKDLRGQVEDIGKVLEFRKHDLDRWADAERAPLLRRIWWLEQTLLPVAQQASFPGGKQSITLPGGTLGRRSQTDRLEIVDAEKALAFSRKHAVPFKEVVEPLVSKLSEYWKSTNKVPAGCRVVPAGDPKPYIK